ncbi:unnamed protein product [Camellia sinensis]
MLALAFLDLNLFVVIVDRFKDYILAKYHSLYEQYLKRSDNAVVM